MVNMSREIWRSIALLSMLGREQIPIKWGNARSFD
jgi:hypothetical protein